MMSSQKRSTETFLPIVDASLKESGKNVQPLDCEPFGIMASEIVFLANILKNKNRVKVLLFIFLCGPINAKQIAEEMKLSQGEVSKILTSLSKANLITIGRQDKEKPCKPKVSTIEWSRLMCSLLSMSNMSFKMQMAKYKR